MSRVEWSSSRYIQQRRKEQSAVAQNQNGLKQNRRIEQNNRIKWAQTEQTELNITEYSGVQQNETEQTVEQKEQSRVGQSRIDRIEKNRTEYRVEKNRINEQS